jgi:hypothetical protein
MVGKLIGTSKSLRSVIKSFKQNGQSFNALHRRGELLNFSISMSFSPEVKDFGCGLSSAFYAKKPHPQPLSTGEGSF